MATQTNVDAKFEQMRDAGRSAKEIAAVAMADRLDFAQTIQMLHRVLNLDFVHAKEAWIQAKGIASSLDEYQENLVPAVEEALAELDDNFK